MYNDSRNKVKQLAKNYARKVAKAAGKKFLAALMPLILSLLPLWIGLVLAIIFFSAIYGSMPTEQHLMEAKASDQDVIIKTQTDLPVQKWNVADYYIVAEESTPESSWYKRTVENQGNTDDETLQLADNLFNDETGKARYLDKNGRDAELVNTWGDVYATLYYKNLQKGEFNFPMDQITTVAKDLHPYFYVKRSRVVVCRPNKEGEIKCHRYPVYLLVEAKTIRGWYQYHYEWVTDNYSDGGHKTYERLVGTVTLEKWEWLENYLIKMYSLKPEEKVITRMLVYNASEGFSNQKEWFNWLTKVFDGYSWASSIMIPPELMPFFKEAEEKYNIPAWFLAAIAYKESSFNSRAHNDRYDAHGLMQTLPENWKKYTKELGFDPVADYDNPRAQIMVGAYMLSELGLKNVNWSGSDWKASTIDVLVHYGGFRGPGAKERCEKEYASVIWGLADSFSNTRNVGWPCEGELSDDFGMRWHPILNEWRFHNGIDIKAPKGTPVISVSGGVAYTGSDNVNGNYVSIKDGYYEYIYCHLESNSVVKGQMIKPGDPIGRVGSTGLSTGPHLHFSIKRLDINQYIDPLSVIDK